MPRKSIVTLAAALLMAACQPATPVETPDDTVVVDSTPTRASDTTSPASEADETGWFKVEEAMGADCGDGEITDQPLGDTACYGQLPKHLASFLRHIPDEHPFLTASEREEVAGKKQRFKAVSGLGQRPDFVAVISHFSLFWIRSFEGADPETTVYLVYGPDCIENANMPRDVECLPGAPYTMRELKAYRVHNGEVPQDVTRDLLPPAPRLTKAERHRYGVYMRPEGDAEDTDVGLDIGRLVYAPVLRWVLRPVQEGDYQPPPMPATDPRAFVDQSRAGHVAHFGFLVWTGTRFELRETVPPSLWPCRTSRSGKHVCGAGYNSRADRYLVDTESTEPEGVSP